MFKINKEKKTLHELFGAPNSIKSYKDFLMKLLVSSISLKCKQPYTKKAIISAIQSIDNIPVFEILKEICKDLNYSDVEDYYAKLSYKNTRNTAIVDLKIFKIKMELSVKKEILHVDYSKIDFYGNNFKEKGSRKIMSTQLNDIIKEKMSNKNSLYNYIGNPLDGYPVIIARIVRLSTMLQFPDVEHASEQEKTSYIKNMLHNTTIEELVSGIKDMLVCKVPSLDVMYEKDAADFINFATTINKDGLDETADYDVILNQLGYHLQVHKNKGTLKLVEVVTLNTDKLKDAFRFNTKYLSTDIQVDYEKESFEFYKAFSKAYPVLPQNGFLLVDLQTIADNWEKHNILDVVYMFCKVSNITGSIKAVNTDINTDIFKRIQMVRFCSSTLKLLNKNGTGISDNHLPCLEIGYGITSTDRQLCKLLGSKSKNYFMLTYQLEQYIRTHSRTISGKNFVYSYILPFSLAAYGLQEDYKANQILLNVQKIEQECKTSTVINDIRNNNIDSSDSRVYIAEYYTEPLFRVPATMYDIIVLPTGKFGYNCANGMLLFKRPKYITDTCNVFDISSITVQDSMGNSPSIIRETQVFRSEADMLNRLAAFYPNRIQFLNKTTLQKPVEQPDGIKSYIPRYDYDCFTFKDLVDGAKSGKYTDTEIDKFIKTMYYHFNPIESKCKSIITEYAQQLGIDNPAMFRFTDIANLPLNDVISIYNTFSAEKSTLKKCDDDIDINTLTNIINNAVKNDIYDYNETAEQIRLFYKSIDPVFSVSSARLSNSQRLSFNKAIKQFNSKTGYKFKQI